MEHDLGSVPLEQRQQAGGAYVHIEERVRLAVRAGIAQVRDAAGRDGVDRDHAMVFGQEAIGQVRTDEPGAPGHQDRGHGAKGRLGSAAMSNPDRSPRCRRAAPRHATIAALSVHSDIGGTRTCRLAAAPSATNRSRRRVFATTPPPISTRSTPVRRAASMVLVTCTSTIASWKLAARSGTSMSRPAARSALTYR